jgi:hypothetical protein
MGFKLNYQFIIGKKINAIIDNKLTINLMKILNNWREFNE